MDMSPLFAFTVTAALAGPPAPSAVPPPTPLVAQAVRLSTAALSTARRPPAPPVSTAQGDSLKNGAITGAVLGAVGFGGFVGYLCNALDETEGHGDCVKAALLAGAVGAAGGAAIGVGVDALFDRPTLNVRVRF